MTRVNMPDPQHLMLDALHAEVYRLHDAGVFDAEDMQWLFEEEPESHVFMSSDITEEDYNEEFATIKEVGSRDLAAKISYWTGVLKRTAESDDEVAPHAPEGDPEFMPVD